MEEGDEYWKPGGRGRVAGEVDAGTVGTAADASEADEDEDREAVTGDMLAGAGPGPTDREARASREGGRRRGLRLRSLRAREDKPSGVWARSDPVEGLRQGR